MKGDFPVHTGNFPVLEVWCGCFYLSHPPECKILCLLLDLPDALNCAQAGCVIIIGTAATYSQQLATCLDDAGQKKAVQQLLCRCCSTVKIIEPNSSVNASKESKFWLALYKLVAVLREALKCSPDGEDLLREILEALKPENGFEDSAKFASGARKVAKIEFWEMVVCHVRTIWEALAHMPD